MDNDRRLEPVVKASLSETKRPRNVFKNFIIGNVKDIGKTILDNVVVPSIKSTATTAADTLVKGLLYGDSSQSPVSQRQRIGSVSYNKMYDYDERREYVPPRNRQNTNYNRRSVYDYTDVEFRTRVERDGTVVPGSLMANDVLNGMREAANRYGWCRVRDIYDLADIHDIGTANDINFGWTPEMLLPEKARVVGSGDVFYIDLPKPIVIER